MAYSQKMFEQDFNLAVEIRVGKDQAKQFVGKTTGPAWTLYQKTMTAPLGLQVFGRHKKNPSELQGEPGIELHGQVFPKLKKKRFLS